MLVAIVSAKRALIIESDIIRIITIIDKYFCHFRRINTLLVYLSEEFFFLFPFRYLFIFLPDTDKTA